MEKAKLPLGEVVTKPESRKYSADEDYTFLIHVPLQGVEERATQLGLGEFTLSKNPLNTSLIDQEHQWTFQGRSGFIIEPSRDTDTVVGAWSYDSGFNDMQREASADTAAGVLRETKPDDYNQINITKGRITGIYIRLREDGSELGDPAFNSQLREFAAQHQLPVAELIVKPVEFNKEGPKVHEHSADRFSVAVNRGNQSISLDVLYSPDRALRGDEGETSVYYSRVRILDGYGMAGNDVTDPAELSYLISELQKILPTITNEKVSKGIKSVVAKYAALIPNS